MALGFVIMGALLAALAVALGAFFTHWPAFATGVPQALQSALNLHQFHALGLLALGLAGRLGMWGQRAGRGLWQASGWLMLVGVVLFCLNVYARYVWGWQALRALVPWGGAAFILAWLSLALGAGMVKTTGAVKSNQRH
jgi:uncharacterized membrane protein YgdD (TMEM256/DUF423 family)